jgi:hypothetical protein
MTASCSEIVDDGFAVFAEDVNTEFLKVDVYVSIWVCVFRLYATQFKPLTSY